MQSAESASGQSDFDFLVGSWKVRHRRLKARLVGSAEWEEFDGTAVMWKLLAGRANVDDHFIELPGSPYRAASLRSFDAASRQWAIWWLDGRNPHHPLDPPVIGSFDQGIGSFFADETFDGQPIRIRFLWSGITPEACLWEQAFSPDAGKTWETNWSMAYTRHAR